MVITDILPRTVSRKTTKKNQFLTKMLESIFPKVWDSFPGQYSTNWRSFCSKFNDKMIRNGSGRSQGARNGKILVSCCIHAGIHRFCRAWGSTRITRSLQKASSIEPLWSHSRGWGPFPTVGNHYPWWAIIFHRGFPLFVDILYRCIPA